MIVIPILMRGKLILLARIGRNDIGAAQPTGQVNIGAALGTKGPIISNTGLFADRTGSPYGHKGEIRSRLGPLGLQTFFIIIRRVSHDPIQDPRHDQSGAAQLDRTGKPSPVSRLKVSCTGRPTTPV